MASGFSSQPRNPVGGVVFVKIAVLRTQAHISCAKDTHMHTLAVLRTHAHSSAPLITTTTQVQASLHTLLTTRVCTTHGQTHSEDCGRIYALG